MHVWHHDGSEAKGWPQNSNENFQTAAVGDVDDDGDLEIIAHPLLITLAVLLYLVEFFADKIPYVDSAWDAVHTVIRPVGGALLAFLALSQGEAVAQTVGALIGGTSAFDSRLTKASTRALINTSPERVS